MFRSAFSFHTNSLRQMPSTEAGPIQEGVRRVNDLHNELESFFEAYKEALKVVEINFKTELNKYACIRLAGFLEQMFFISIRSYILATSNGKSSSFALSQWKKAPNLGPEALDKLIDRFESDDWKESLARLTGDDGFRGNLGTLLKVRNNSAHGNSYSGNVRSVDSYKDLIDRIYIWVLDTLLKS